MLLAAGILEGTVRSESKPLLLLPPVSEVEGPGRAGGACLRASFLASLLLPGAVLPAGAAVHGCGEDGQRRRSELSKEEHKQPWARVMGSVTSVLSEDRLERKGPLRPAPRGLGEAEQRPCVRSGSELWSLAPAFGPSPVVRPVPALLRCSPCLGSAFLWVKALRQPPAPTARSAHRRNRRGRACGGACSADLALPAGAPQSVQPCPTRPKPAGLNRGPVLTQGPVTEPAPRLACWEGAAQGACCLEQELGCHPVARGHLNHLQRQLATAARQICGWWDRLLPQRSRWHSVEHPRSQGRASPAALVRDPDVSGGTGPTALHGAGVPAASRGAGPGPLSLAPAGRSGLRPALGPCAASPGWWLCTGGGCSPGRC